MFLYYILAIVVIAIDQLSKWLIASTMEIGQQITIIGNFFALTSHRNSGAAWGILQGQMGFFYIITIIVVAGLVYYMQKYARDNQLLAIALSLILGGAIGNFIDRLFRKEVVDFFDFVIFGYDFPIFNIADSALSIGVILVIIITIIDERKEKLKHDSTAQSNRN
ncbi:signal peptidase II Aspartic peptidase. MEROPS family A08 [Lentibacillus persicus]|uniref:Lipoprotein signal peptidase n=1 Tax=Lentibacillus persicus TaxID=640948 RepID=A0A1I1VMB2_9BACI|nr:signal peptidase II [Lentibacillus persicus]SFD82193.1 signal peptidase II Aspartic peptidase. MEROPS family A08 [Lentibacillus persicus]